jgi:ATP-binding cassette subfamily B protein
MDKNKYTIGDNKDLKKVNKMGGPFGGIKVGEKPKNFAHTWGKLIVFLRPYWWLIIIAILFAIFGVISSLIGPKQLSKIADLVLAGFDTGIDLPAITQIGILLAILYGVGFVFNYFQGFIMATITQRVSKKLRSRISEKINKLPLRFFDSSSRGDILSRVTNDIDTISKTLNQSITSLVSAITMFAGALILMFSINFILTVSALLSTAIGFGLMILIISKSQKYFIRQQRQLGEINGHIEEIYAGHDVVKAYNGEKSAREIFGKINDELYQDAWLSQFLSGLMQPLMGFVGNFGYVVVCVVGAFLAMNDVITFGVIVAFMIYIRLFTQPLSQFAQAGTNLQSTAAASERVFEFLEENELADESQKTATLQNIKGAVLFENIHFGYSPDKIIINNFSVEIQAGQKIAIVGPTGAGKTTLVNLLMRFYELNSGDIKIDGVSIKSLTRENVHSLFCMVLQDTWLFDGTIKENIIFNKQGATHEQVREACVATGVHHFIHTLPNSYDTILDDKTNLSAGQKQLITIARAMIADSPILILDEATSSVDTRTEILVQQAMDKLMHGRTSFVIAHRLSTIKNADLILVMNNGDIVESGTHDILLAKNGFYAGLYNSQFEE